MMKKIIYGQGKEYSEVSREVESTFQNWLAASKIDEVEFDTRMKLTPHRIDECINSEGLTEINIYAGNQKVIIPLLHQGDASGSIEDFIINALFLLSYIASRYSDKDFEKAVIKFADNMIKEKKIKPL